MSNPPASWGSNYPNPPLHFKPPLRKKERWPVQHGDLRVQLPPRRSSRPVREVPFVKGAEIVMHDGWHPVLIPRLIESLFNYFRNDVFRFSEETSKSPYYTLDGPLPRPPGIGNRYDPFVLRLPALKIPTLRVYNPNGTPRMFIELPLDLSTPYYSTAAPRSLERGYPETAEDTSGRSETRYNLQPVCDLLTTAMEIRLPTWIGVKVSLREVFDPQPSSKYVSLHMQIDAQHQQYFYILNLDLDTRAPAPISQFVPVERS